MTDSTLGNEFWVRCPTCHHAWVAAYLPMEAFTFAKVARRAACAKCGNTNGILCGKGESDLPTPPSEDKP